MQKRVGRPVDQLLKRKTLKRPRFPEINKDGSSMPMEYVRLGLMWLSVVGLDLCTGIRFELFWPFIVICRLGWAAFNKDKNIMVTLANTNTSHMSMLFVCITATADLICYLFIPLQWIIFLSCTYVWISCLWASYGGFLIALSTLTSERSKAAPLLMTTGMIIFFEYFIRQRCDITTQESDNLISIFLKGQGCDFIQSPKSLPSGLNSFFGAHCIGYPFILISMSFRYFLREWSINRRVSKVSRRNEQFVKVLTEALPAAYEGPRDYSIRQPIPEEECEVLGPNFDLQPMLMAPPPTNGTNVRKISKSNGMRNRQPSKSKQNATPPAVKGARRGADEGYDEDSDEFNEIDERSSSQTGVGSLFWMRPFEWLFQLLGWVFSTPSALPERPEEEVHDTVSEEYKKTLRNGDINRNRAGTTSGPRSSRRPKDKPKEKVITAHPVEREKDVSLQMNGGPKAPETRDSSRDTSLSTNATSRISVSLEVERLKSDINHLRNAEQDSKLQLVAARNTENQLRSENTNLKASMDRAENRIKILEKQRDSSTSNMSQLEKKYAELLNKKNDVERELNAERKARKEDGGRKEQTNEQFREREREQEAMIEHLKHESVTREDRMMSVQKEMYELRKYRESEVTEREEEIRSLKSRILGLEESLQSENKLKQDLFRALGEARTHNAQLEAKLRTSHELAVNAHQPVSNSEKAPPTQHQQQTVHQPPPYNMIMQQQQSKCSDVSTASPYLFSYTAMHQHHSSPTGEHLLFEQSSSPSLLSNLQGTLHDPLLATRMGKFGAPANPARIN